MNLRSIAMKGKKYFGWKTIRKNCFQSQRAKVSLLFIHKAYRHCFRFMSGYRHGMTGGLLDYAVKKYKSHRHIPDNMINELAEEYKLHHNINKCNK